MAGRYVQFACTLHTWHCKDQDHYNKSYIDIAHKSKINIEGLTEPKIRARINKLLLQNSQLSKVLFILDNVNKQEDIYFIIQELHKLWPINNSPHILITTRNQDWSNKPIVINIFTDREAHNFVRKYLRDAGNDDVTRLIKELNN